MKQKMDYCFLRSNFWQLLQIHSILLRQQDVPEKLISSSQVVNYGLCFRHLSHNVRTENRLQIKADILNLHQKLLPEQQLSFAFSVEAHQLRCINWCFQQSIFSRLLRPSGQFAGATGGSFKISADFTSCDILQYQMLMLFSASGSFVQLVAGVPERGESKQTHMNKCRTCFNMYLWTNSL